VPNIGFPELLMMLVLWIVPVVLTAWLAAKKGYSPAVWTIIAIFITWVALIIVLVLPRRAQAA